MTHLPLNLASFMLHSSAQSQLHELVDKLIKLNVNRPNWEPTVAWWLNVSVESHQARWWALRGRTSQAGCGACAPPAGSLRCALALPQTVPP